MFSSKALLALTVLGTLATATTATAIPVKPACAKPTVNVPAHPIDPLVISGTTTAPCGLIYIYINGEVKYVAGAEGASHVDNAPWTFTYTNDLDVAKGELQVKVRAEDGAGEYMAAESDEVTIVYGP